MASTTPTLQTFLELDGGMNFGDFVAEVFTVGDQSRELAN
jgi:hypothetical protein